MRQYKSVQGVRVESGQFVQGEERIDWLEGRSQAKVHGQDRIFITLQDGLNDLF